MKQAQANLFTGKMLFVKRIGYALVALSLILLTLLTSAPEFEAPSATLYSYVLFAAGVALVLFSKGWEIIQYSRLSKRRAYCPQCGWYGTGKEWLQSECCPECDSEQVRVD